MLSPMSHLLLSLVLLAVPQAAPQPGARIEVAVDRRVELLTLVARMAGFGEFNQPNSRSRYTTAADAWFAPHKTHPVFAKLQQMRAAHGVSFDAIPCLAVHLTDSIELEERIPFDAKPERLDTRWPLDETRAFLVLLRDFAAKSDSEGFFDSRADLFAESEKRMRDVVARMKALPWFDAVFGARTGARYVAIPGLVCGGGNFGVGVRFADATPEEILPVFGMYQWDEKGFPIVDAAMEGLFIHELCHSYTNAMVDRIAAELEAPLTAIHASCADVMAKQAYSTWRTVAYESLVRACTIRARFVTEGAAAAKQQAGDEVGRGFLWVPSLAEELGRYEADRAKWATFESFLPEIVRFFGEVAAAIAIVEKTTPKLLEITPADGALDVDPALATMTIRFDRAMGDGCSIVGDPASTPKAVGAPTWDADRKVLTVPVKLDSGKSYRFALNSPRHQNFRSREGTPLKPIEIAFTTR